MRTAAMIGIAAMVLTACSGDTADPDPTPPTGDQTQEPTEPTEPPATEAAEACDAVDLTQAPGQPVTIRYGMTGGAGEEPLALLWADKDAYPNHGSFYELETTEYAATDRLTAVQAGQIDAGTFSFPALVTAVSAGVGLRGVASIVDVNTDDNQAAWAVLEDSDFSSMADLAGARIGYLGPNTSTEYWITSALAHAGVDPGDVTFVNLPVPAQLEALRNGSIDVAFLARQFLHIGNMQGGIEVLVRPYEAVGMDQPSLVAAFDPQFIEDNPEAYCAWRADYQQAMQDWLADIDGSVTLLVDAEYLTPAAANAGPFPGRNPNAALVLADMDATMADMVESGFMDPARVSPAEELVLTGYSLTE